MTTTIEVLNTTRTALNSTQQKTSRIYEETKNNEKINCQISFGRNTMFRALSQGHQITTNNRPLLVLSNRLVPT
jgi:hypothetical protein